jgi:hypothetical protein
MSEPLPEQTTDDTDVGWSEPPSDEDDDQRLRDDVPPHHSDRD